MPFDPIGFDLFIASLKGQILQIPGSPSSVQLIDVVDIDGKLGEAIREWDVINAFWGQIWPILAHWSPREPISANWRIMGPIG